MCVGCQVYNDMLKNFTNIFSLFSKKKLDKYKYGKLSNNEKYVNESCQHFILHMNINKCVKE